MKLEEKLVALRKEKGLTQLQLAEMLNVSRQAVSRWEGGLAVPSLENLKYLGNLYNVPLDYLLSDNEEVCNINKHPREHLEDKESTGFSNRIKNSMLDSYAKLYTLFLFVLLFLLEAIPGTVIMVPGYPHHTTIYRYSFCNIEPALRLNCAPFISFMLTVCCALFFLARGALINRTARNIANTNFDTKTKSLKQAAGTSDEVFDILKSAARRIKIKTAVQHGIIGGFLVGTAGLLLGAQLNNKKDK